MLAVVGDRLAAAIALTNSLSAGLGAAELALRNGSERSNTIGSQLWCVVGARESYAAAIEAGAWQGFSCSLEEPGLPSRVREALASSGGLARAVVAAVAADDAVRLDLVVALLEHEVQHHGQLIRYFFANDLPFPAAFAERYAL